MVEDMIDRSWRIGWHRPSRDEIHRWAMDHVVLDGDYARTGRFSMDGSRYLELPFELLGDDTVRMLNILKSPQSAGTLVADIALQWWFANRPGPTMVTFQSDDDAEQHYLTRIEKTFLATPVNRALFIRLKKKRDLYRWPHMSAYFQGANINSLQRKSIRYEVNDEVWCWRPGMLGEAWARTEAFRRDCKILNISQAGEVGTEWERTWNNGRRYEYGVHCLECGHLQPLVFFARMEKDEKVHAGVVWDREARFSDGRWNITRAAETTRFRCRHCGHEHADEPLTWARLDARGAYVCHDPDRGMSDCSVRWNGMVLGDWGRMTRRFLQACEVRDGGSTAALEQFYEKDLALFWDPALTQEKVELQLGGFAKEAPFSAGYQPERLPWETMRIITADYQQGTGNDTRHLIVICRAWADSSAKRSRLLWEGRCNTFEDVYRLQLALGVDASCVCIDGSFEMMEVAAQCAKYGWTMLIGDDAEVFLHRRKGREPRRLPFSERFRVDPGKGKASQGRRACWAFRWSNPSIKNVLWNLRHGLAKHTWEIPHDVSPSYREGIDAEAKRRVVVKKTGAPKWVWVQLLPNNHAWDCECMQVVVAIAAGCLTFDVEPEEQPQKPDAAARRQAADSPQPPHDKPQQLELIAV